MKRVLCSAGCLWLLLGCLDAGAQVGGPGFALAFNSAQNQNLQANGIPALTNQLTFEAWVNVASPICGTILSRGNGGDGTKTDYILQIGNNGTTCEPKLSFFGVNAWDTSTNTLSLNTWTHVAVTFDGSNKQFYINGQPDLTAPRGGSLHGSTSAMLIGIQGTTCFCNPFNGIIDEIRVWNTVRTADQIQQYMNLSLAGNEPGLVAYYRMDEGSGTSTADATGHGYTAAMGAGTQAPAWVRAGEILGTPAITPLPVTGLTTSSATLNATVNPETQATGAWFEWGTDLTYGNTNAISSVGSGTNPVPISATLTGLVLGTTYHYHCQATNSSAASA